MLGSFWPNSLALMSLDFSVKIGLLFFFPLSLSSSDLLPAQQPKTQDARQLPSTPPNEFHVSPTSEFITTKKAQQALTFSTRPPFCRVPEEKAHFAL